MTNTTLKSLEKNTSEILLKIQNPEIKEEYEKAIKKIIEDFEAPGFRKGKAPREIVEKNINQEKVASMLVQNLLPKKYSEAIQEHKLQPIVDPKIYIEEPKNISEILDDKDLTIKIVVAEAPIVDLKNYSEKIKGSAAKSKIWTPEKGEKQEEKPETQEEKDQKKFIMIIDELLKTCSVETADMIVESETNRLLSQTLEEIKKLGLSLEEYLKNTGKTAEMIQKETKEKAENNLKLEFIFNAIAKEQKIEVIQADIDNIIAQIKDEKQKEEAKKNSYQIAPVLLRQKVINFLMTLG
jgi:FKBP-type peptidyl-prolyl cis-trans isomerase (trigger factor)